MVQKLWLITNRGYIDVVNEQIWGMGSFYVTKSQIQGGGALCCKMTENRGVAIYVMFWMAIWTKIG